VRQVNEIYTGQGWPIFIESLKVQSYLRSFSSVINMSSTRLIYFMYHHYQHCFLSKVSKMTTPSTESFTLFPVLPAELRLKVWDMVAEEPNTLEISCTPTASYLPDGRWFSHSKPPTIFRICSESRAVAMAHYDVLTFSPDVVGIPCKGDLYINFSVDTLWVCSVRIPSLF
jgi:hypothetical protein